MKVEASQLIAVQEPSGRIGGPWTESVVDVCAFCRKVGRNFALVLGSQGIRVSGLYLSSKGTLTSSVFCSQCACVRVNVLVQILRQNE